MLMIKGDLVRLDLDGPPDIKIPEVKKDRNGWYVQIPDDFGMVSDPTGVVLNRCDVFICRCHYASRVLATIPRSIDRLAREYFGEDAPLVKATVEIPDGPWHRLGTVRQIHYERYGENEILFPRDGPWYHPFSDSAVVEVFKSGCCKAYLLQLPNGCVLNERGFVKP